MKAVKPKKNLGQHFLTDLNIAKRIATRWMPALIYLFWKSDRVWAFLPNIS